jgi:hypothetical protein
MKNLLILFLLVIAGSAFGQETKQTDTLSFCGKTFKIPDGCKAESAYQLECDTFSIQWLYMNDAMLKTMPDRVVAQLEEQMKDFKKEPFTPYLSGTKVMGYKVSYKVNSNPVYQIIAYGVVNSQPVLLQLTQKNEPKTNASIPEFARQIVRLTK